MLTIRLVAHQMLSTLTVRMLHSRYGTMWCMTSIHWARTALSHLHWEVKKGVNFDDIDSTCDLYTGSCLEAGYTECCSDFICLGAPTSDCFCDPSCHAFGDCCYDIDETCPRDDAVLPTSKLEKEREKEWGGEREREKTMYKAFGSSIDYLHAETKSHDKN